MGLAKIDHQISGTTRWGRSQKGITSFPLGSVHHVRKKAIDQEGRVVFVRCHQVLRGHLHRLVQGDVFQATEYEDFKQVQGVSAIPCARAELADFKADPGGLYAITGDDQGGNTWQDLIFPGVAGDDLALPVSCHAGKDAELLGEAIGFQAGITTAPYLRDQDDLVDLAILPEVDFDPLWMSGLDASL